MKLLKEAGFKFGANRKLIDANGTPFSVEIISGSPNEERFINPFVDNLRDIGVDASLRILDTAQFKLRTDNFEFDMASLSTIQSLSPGNEQRDYCLPHRRTSLAAETMPV